MLPCSLAASERESSNGDYRGGGDKEVDEECGKMFRLLIVIGLTDAADSDSHNEDDYHGDVTKFVENDTSKP